MTSLAPNALWKLKGALINGFNYTKEDLLGEFDLDTEELIGAEVAVIIVDEEYNGEIRSRVEDVCDASAANEGPALL